MFTFKHPNREERIVNERVKSVKFRAPQNCVLTGFAGYFETVLYKEVMLSINPQTHSPNMVSWFPILFPLAVRTFDLFEFFENALFYLLGTNSNNVRRYDWRYFLARREWRKSMVWMVPEFTRARQHLQSKWTFVFYQKVKLTYDTICWIDIILTKWINLSELCQLEVIYPSVIQNFWFFPPLLTLKLTCNVFT